MSDDKLKKVMEEKYKEALKAEEEKKAEEVSEKEEPKVVYIPYIDEDNKHYMLKVQIKPVIVNGKFYQEKSEAKIINVSDLDQEVIALKYGKSQEGDKYFYLKNNKLGDSDE